MYLNRTRKTKNSGDKKTKVSYALPTGPKRTATPSKIPTADVLAVPPQSSGIAATSGSAGGP